MCVGLCVHMVNLLLASTFCTVLIDVQPCLCFSSRQLPLTLTFAFWLIQSGGRVRAQVVDKVPVTIQKCLKALSQCSRSVGDMRRLFSSFVLAAYKCVRIHLALPFWFAYTCFACGVNTFVCTTPYICLVSDRYCTWVYSCNVLKPFWPEKLNLIFNISDSSRRPVWGKQITTTEKIKETQLQHSHSTGINEYDDRDITIDEECWCAK